jgi:hypothetical protein
VERVSRSRNSPAAFRPSNTERSSPSAGG